MLSQALRRLGKPAIPLPAFAASQVGSFVRQSRVADFSPEQMAYLTYGRGVDTTRMRDVLGFEPEYTTATAFEDLCRAVGTGPLSADRVSAVEGFVTQTLGVGRG
jgi:UDP-glucose 4-epimerase